MAWTSKNRYEKIVPTVIASDFNSMWPFRPIILGFVTLLHYGHEEGLPMYCVDLLRRLDSIFMVEKSVN